MSFQLWKADGDSYIICIKHILFKFTNSKEFPEHDVIVRPSDYK